MPQQHVPTVYSRILVTGAGGFVGTALIDALLHDAPDAALVAADIAFPHRATDPRITYLEGPLDSGDVWDALTVHSYDCIYHLATVAGVGSLDFDLGRRTNLDATIRLLDAARASGAKPRFVYASSVGVFAPPLPPVVTDETLPVPASSYGTHKLVCEYLLSDYSRAGFVDGLALRLPGIIARPAGSTTMLSAFLNDIFYAARQGAPFAIPLAPEDGSWVMSLESLIRNLLHARRIPAETLPERRFWNLPAGFFTMGDLVAELQRVFGEAAMRLSFRPDPAMQAMFAQVPLEASGAERLGFSGDGGLTRFVANVIARLPSVVAPPA